MKFSFIAASALLASTAFTAYAQQTSTSTANSKSSVTIEDLKEKNKVQGDIDQEITNAKLRAESGSKSKWSGSFTASYLGASLEKPFDNSRPNTSQEATPPRVNMGGDIGIRYRMNKNNSLSLGTGYSLQEPFHRAQYGDISDPYVGFNDVRKIGQVQNVAAVQAALATNADERALKQEWAASISDVLLYDFGGSKWTVGLVSSFAYNYFTKGSKDQETFFRNDPDDKFKAGRYQQDYQISFAVPVEYAINDRFQLRTVFRPWTFVHNPFKDGNTYSKRRWTQSAGIVCAVTRDINLYPNFQWDWEQWRGRDFNFFAKDVRANSTIGLQATINVF